MYFYLNDECDLLLKKSEDRRFLQGQNQERMASPAMCTFKTINLDMHFKLIKLVRKTMER